MIKSNIAAAFSLPNWPSTWSTLWPLTTSHHHITSIYHDPWWSMTTSHHHITSIYHDPWWSLVAFLLHLLNVTLIYYASLVNFLIMKFYIYKFRKRYCFLNCEVTQHKIKLRTTGKITPDISLLWKQKIKCWTNTEATCCCCCCCYYNVTMQTNRMLMASALMLDCFSRTRTVLRWPCWMATWRAATWTNENVVSSI